MNKLNTFLAISFLGTITNFVTDAKSIIGALAALASLIASCYAIAIARHRLKRLPSRKPLRSSRPSRLKKLIARCSLLIVLLCITGCETAPGAPNPIARGLDRAAVALTATTTNVTAHEIVIANEMIALDPATRQLTTNITFTTNLTLLTNITAIARPILTRTIAAGETASGFLPSPYGEAAAGGLALLSALLAAAVRRRNTMLKTVIQGVENSGSAETKKGISDLSKLVGVAQDLHALVKKHT